ncbi:hypothetical protein ACH5RR_031103 [Cinchona calisaya]|uniref:Glycosyltransferase n=1 Tax=Cinchona calisaya TaxID=153742 RepID=A0ABD2YG85_9GENT
MDDDKDSVVFRVLMFPWLAHGHISPFLELSKELTKKNFKIYFCSTPIILEFIKENLDENYLSDQCIELVEFHLPELPELPAHYHTTKNLPPHLISTLINSYENSMPIFSKIINNLNPDLLIYDGFQSWAPALATKNDIPCVHFSTTGAAVMALYYHLLNFGFDSHDSFPFSAIFQTERERKIIQALFEANEGVDEVLARCFEQSSEFVLIKSLREIEEKYLDYLSILSGKKIVTLGPLIEESNHNDENNDHVDIIEFLNKKDQSSVVYVSFGSEYFLSKEEMEEIARGLELSNVNFIWVIRFPLGNKIGIEEALPEGFLERVKKRGMVVEGWAPQAKILEHSSTGGFLSHCGWSSALESFYFGVPLIAMPIHLDQPTIARFAVEISVGLEVLRDENGNIEGEEIAEVIKMVVLDPKTGEEMRGKARELRKKLREKGEEELHVALEELRNLCIKNKK